MENIVVSHQSLMNSLLNNQLRMKNSNGKQLCINGKPLKGDFLNCLILSSPCYPYPIQIPTVKDILRELRDAYCAQFDNSIETTQVGAVDVVPTSGVESLMAASASTMDHSESVQHAIAGASGMNEYLIEDSRIASLESIRERMLHKIQLIVENGIMPPYTTYEHLFFDGLKYLGTILKDTQITHLDIAWNGIDCDMLIYIVETLRVSKLTILNLDQNKVGHKGKEYLERVLRDPEPQISSLDVRCNTIDINSSRTVVQSSSSTATNTLNLRYGQTVGNGGLEDLMSTLRDSPITTLNLENNPMPFRNFDVFTSNLPATSLTCLNLGHNHLSYNNICSLANVLKDTEITTLGLADAGMRDKRLEALASGLTNSKISYLNLADNELGYDDMKCLARVLKYTQITGLDIGEDSLGCKNLQVFLECLVETKISRLAIRCDELTVGDPDCIKYLASILKHTQITFLNLQNNYIECNRLKYLVLCLPDTKITELDLRDNFICCNVFNLASVLHQTQISTIHLCGNRFAENSHPKQFLDGFNGTNSSLNLEGKHICTISLYYLSNVLRKTNITELNLKANYIDYDGLKYLCQGLIGSQIVSLDLSENCINSTGIKYLAQVLKQTRITSLNLANNEISCSGWKYLLEVLEGSQITSLDLSYNSIGDEGIEFPAINLERNKIVELNLSYNNLSREAAYQLCQSVQRCRRDSIVVEIGLKDESLSKSCLKLLAYPGCFIETNEPVIEKGVADLLKNTYEKVGITKLILYGRLGQFLEGACNKVSVSEIDFRSSDLNKEMISIFDQSNIAEIKVHGGLDMKSLHLLSKINFRALSFNALIGTNLTGIESFFKSCNIMYLDLSDTFLKPSNYNTLVNALKESNIISLNLSKTKLRSKTMKLLAKVLPHTKINYIDLSSNDIDYSGFKCLMDVVSETDICCLSLKDNDINTELLPKGIDLSPYIVPRNDTPIAFQMRYLFLELVSLNSSSNEFEFIIPPKNSEFTLQINHYPWFVKNVLEIPNSYVHLYDLFYMKNKRHDIHVLNKFDIFVKEIRQNFRTFFVNSLVELEEAFGYESFVDLVKESEASGLNDIVEFLLLHRVLYYVDENKKFLHPFIYKMLQKYGLPLFSLQLDQNIQERMVAFFQEHLEIDGAQDIIDWFS